MPLASDLHKSYIRCLSFTIMEYVGRIGLYTHSNTNYTWLIRIDHSESKRGVNDLFSHKYLSGQSILVDNSTDKLTPVPETRMNIKDIRATFVKILDNREELTTLFE